MMEDGYKKTYKRLQSIYRNMMKRCHNKNNHDYKYYGAKGISVCNSWRQSFPMFCVWALENGYNNGLTLDRKDNNGDYCPENCRWVTWAEQNRNKTQTRNIEINGETKCLKDWCSELNLNYYTVAMRIHRGMNEKEALGI